MQRRRQWHQRRNATEPRGGSANSDTDQHAFDGSPGSVVHIFSGTDYAPNTLITPFFSIDISIPRYMSSSFTPAILNSFAPSSVAGLRGPALQAVCVAASGASASEGFVLRFADPGVSISTSTLVDGVPFVIEALTTSANGRDMCCMVKGTGETYERIHLTNSGLNQFDASLAPGATSVGGGQVVIAEGVDETPGFALAGPLNIIDQAAWSATDPVEIDIATATVTGPGTNDPSDPICGITGASPTTARRHHRAPQVPGEPSYQPPTSRASATPMQMFSSIFTATTS